MVGEQSDLQESNRPQKSTPNDTILACALSCCDDTPSEALALVASCAFELAFVIADDDRPSKEVLVPMGRILATIGEQFVVWSRDFEDSSEGDVPRLRKLLRPHADRRRQRLAQQLARRMPQLLRVQPEEAGEKAVAPSREQPLQFRIKPIPSTRSRGGVRISPPSRRGSTPDDRHDLTNG